MFDGIEAAAPVSKADFETRSAELRVALLNLQFDLRESNAFPVVVVIGGDDRRSSTEVVETLHEWMDARYLHGHFFGRPTEEERERPRFWRYWRVLPPRGTVGIYVGAWAHGAVVDRLSGELDDDGWAIRIGNIATFEQELVDQGCCIVKFWMHQPKKQLAKRLRQARKHPEKAWRVDARDWEIYESYDDVVDTARTLLEVTNREGAEWNVLRVEDKRGALLQAGELLRHALVGHLSRTTANKTRGTLDAPKTGKQRIGAVDLTARLEEDDYKKQLRHYQARIARRTERAAEEGRTSVLVFEGPDAAGKGGAIRRILHAMDLRDYRVVPIAAPSERELQHHYLWRFWNALPRAGRLVVFDRSWYGRVLVERVEGLATEHQWRRAYGEINDFERQMTDHGYLVHKFWLHINKAEQLRRFEVREQTPFKKYKITDEDYRNREKWDRYAEAADEMFARTDTKRAPWHVIAANDKRWARIEVLKTFARALKAERKKRKGSS